MDAATGGESRKGIEAMTPLPSARKGSSKLALVSLAILCPQGRRGKGSLQCDPTSLVGGDSACYAPESP